MQYEVISLSSEVHCFFFVAAAALCVDVKANIHFFFRPMHMEFKSRNIFHAIFFLAYIFASRVKVNSDSSAHFFFTVCDIVAADGGIMSEMRCS